MVPKFFQPWLVKGIETQTDGRGQGGQTWGVISPGLLKGLRRYCVAVQGGEVSNGVSSPDSLKGLRRIEIDADEFNPRQFIQP